MNEQFATKYQEQFWILNRISDNTPAYNIPVVFKLDVLPDMDKLENAVNRLIKKYDVLLSEYSLENGRVMMHFKDYSKFQFKIAHEHFPLKEVKDKLPQEVLDEVNKPFNLAQAPLFRIKIFEYPDVYYLSFMFHHIIVDLRSKEIFFKELGIGYNEGYAYDTLPESNAFKSYRAFALEHNEWLKSSEADKMMQLWKHELPPINHLLNLPLSKTRPKSIQFQGKRTYFSLDKDIGALINHYASNMAINNFTFCLSAYFILLNKFCQQNKIVIGVPLSNRRDQNNWNVFGCFVNIVPIQVNFENNPEIKDIIKQVRNQLLFAHRKQEIPFLSLIEQEKENRNLAYNPYFQTGFTFEPLAELQLEGIDVQAVPVERKGTQLDLFITMWENDEGFHGYVEYSTKLFSESMAKRIELSYKKTIKEIIDNKKYVSELSVLTAEDNLMLRIWNDTKTKINTNKCLHEQFEAQVLATPDEIAIRFNEKSLTYIQLNKHANRLANFLIERGIQVEDIVAISIARSLELIISIIAIHKAGAAYLPIDARYPKERISNIIEDGEPKIILTTSEIAVNLPDFDNVILIDDILTKPFSKNETNPNIKINSKNLAFLMFTSGSTGRPKGVMIEHHSVINKLLWMQNQHPIGKGESLLLKTPVTFDVSVWELFWWFFNGSSLTILPPNGEKDPKAIIETTANNAVSTLIFVPSMFAPFVEYLRSKNSISKLNNLKYFILIGEALSTQLVMDFNELRTKYFSPKLVNTYGPTEATVAVSYYNCPETNPVDRIFIGKPIFNTKLWIIDKNNHICPIGVQGELVISGENLARGYKKNPQLNNTKFIEIKDLEEHNVKVYRTGDIAKWDENGELDFIGRVDNQVKIRGYRIELGDIETKLLQHESVETAVVIVKKVGEGNQQLIAYVVLKENIPAKTDNIKRFLKEALPEYMVPNHIVVLNKMPLNSSEKIDRKALPNPILENSMKNSSPLSDTAKILSEIWSNLLNIKNIGIRSNFFDLGGNSLLLISMAAQIQNKLNTDIEPLTVLEYPNIQVLSKHLDDINTVDIQDQSYLNIKQKALLRKRNRNSPPPNE